MQETNSQQLMEEIRILRARLKERDIIQQKLEQAQKLEAIGTLAGGIAHDLNNILFPIIGYTEMAMDHLPLESPIRKNLDQVLTGANRARELVRQILTFSRHYEQEKRPLKIQHIIKEVLVLIRSTLPTTINIRQKINNKCRSVLADPTQIHQVIMNLCANAYHAMRDNGGDLEISVMEDMVATESPSCVSVLNYSNYIILRVSDTGHGMDDSTLKRIFEPYYTTKNQNEGTGLGLSLVHSIVKNHNGFIRVESNVGLGSTFYLYFPVLNDCVTDPKEIFSGPIPIGSGHILLVDDEEQIVSMQEKTLTRLGYRVTVETDSIKALKTFQENPGSFDIVITDMTMPNMTGIELSQKLLAIRNDISIVLCTGFSENITEEKVKQLGIKEFVMKPLIRSEIACVLRKVLG